MSSQKKFSVRQLTVAGMMVAITTMLAYSPLGIIPMVPVSATITHIPTIIIAILEGPLMGAIVGAAFGITSLVKSVTQPVGIFAPCFINPLVSILPRVLIGVVSSYVYRGVFAVSKKKLVSAVIASCLGSLTNTIGVMGMIYVLYAKTLTEQIGKASESIIWGVITTYGLVEMAVAAVICTFAVVALQKVYYRNIRLEKVL